MKKHIGILLLICGLIPFLITACAPSIESENVTKETVITNMATTTENEKETVEEFTDDGEKITTFKISKDTSKRCFGDTTVSLKEFLESGTYWVILDDFVSVDNRGSYVELKMSESDIYICRKRMFEYLGVGPSNKLENNLFYYYNDEYNKIVAYVQKDEWVDRMFDIGELAICLETLQMLDGVDSNEWKVDVTVINPETGNTVIEMRWHEKNTLSDDDWK